MSVNDLVQTPFRRSTMPPNHVDISNSTTKRFNNVVQQYMHVHKISSLNPAVVTQAADHSGIKGDSYHQWDQYNPPTPTVNFSRAYCDPRIMSEDELKNVETPSLDAYQFDNWSVGDSLKRPDASLTKERRDPNDGITESTPRSIIHTNDLTPIAFNINVGNPESSPNATVNEESLKKECSSSDNIHNSAETTCNRKRAHPVIPFLPANHHLDLPVLSRTKSHTSMSSFWNDYERTANGSAGDNTPMRYLNYSGSQTQTTPGSAFSNSVFGSQIDSIMEPDSLEKKSVAPEVPIRNLPEKKGRHSFAHSSTVASCLPPLLMSEYTESPPYMPTESFNYDVPDNGGTQQKSNVVVNNNSASSSGRLRTSQRNLQHSAERSGNIRNSFSGSLRSASVTTRNETSDQPMTAAPYLVLDSLADDLEEKENDRRWIVISIYLMIIGAIIHIIGQSILVYTQNKKFAPYNGIYPNGCKDVIMIEGAMTLHGVNCTEYLAQQVLDEET